jgi:hypothetical protein
MLTDEGVAFLLAEEERTSKVHYPAHTTRRANSFTVSMSDVLMGFSVIKLPLFV